MQNWYCSICHFEAAREKRPETCPQCQADQRMILDKEEEVPASLEQARDRARKSLKGICAAYPACDGNYDRICQREAYGKPIGMGGVGQGASFRANVAALNEIRLKTRLVGEHFEPDTSCTFLGHDLAFPVLASSTAGVANYNEVMAEVDFCRAVVRGSREAGSVGLRGDTWFYTVEDHPALTAIQEVDGWGVPIFKPRSQDVLKTLIDKAQAAGCRAVGLDLDGCGSTNMTRHGQPVFRKSVKEIAALVAHTDLPFIAKGIMEPDDAEKCVQAGVAAVAVSNHGGRVLDSTPGVAEVLPAIRQRLGHKVTITADGGVRTGYDVLKMLALGADFVMIGRDIIRAAVGGGSLGVRLQLEHIRTRLQKAMLMTGTRDLSGDIGSCIVR